LILILGTGERPVESAGDEPTTGGREGDGISGGETAASIVAGRREGERDVGGARGGGGGGAETEG
tara:strand:+ start:212 stop:406 length:195 start_codon:yes stop_codon:yes gene_type:complete